MMNIVLKIVGFLRHMLAIILFPIFIVIALYQRYFCFEHKKSTDFRMIIGDVLILSVIQYAYVSGSDIRIWG